MKREIKFRGMDVQGRWFFGNVSIIPKKLTNVDAGCYISNEAGMPFAYRVRPETVSQFTGLKDKNGVEIYEGDILKYTTHYYGQKKERQKVVRWEQWTSDDFGQPECIGFFHVEDHMEVIGNIYENPELIQN